MMQLHHGIQRQRMLLSGVRSLRQMAKAASPISPEKKQAASPNSGHSSNTQPKDSVNGFNALGLFQPLLDGISAQGII
jgi:hypothetical protein